MITPEDISDEMIAKAEAECNYNVGGWEAADPTEVAAAILNAAIEAGVVSPSIWNVIDLASGEIVATYQSRNDALSEAAKRALLRQNCSVEHWKG